MSAARFVYGVGPVRELLGSRAGSVAMLYVVPEAGGSGKGKGKKQSALTDLVRMARDRRIEVQEVSRRELEQLLAGPVNHQGVAAIAGEYRYAEVDDMLDRARSRGEAPLVVAADGVTDPHNLGAILRSAYLLGAHGVIIPRDRAASVTAVATKVSAGASEHIAVAQVTNLARVLGELKQDELWIAGAATGQGAIAPWQLDGKLPLCLVVGSEGSGIRPLVRKQCDYLIEIPMAGTAVGSFNVSVATALLLYEVAKQRRLTE